MPADKYSNKAYISLTESAANTLTFKELETGVSLFEKRAWIIHRIEYFIDNAAWAELLGAADSLMLGLVLSNKITSLDLSDAAVIDLVKINIGTAGTPASGFIGQSPRTRDFSTLPGGGHIVPPRPLYGAINAGGFSAAATSSIRFLYTAIEMKTEEYWELVEAYRLVE